VNYVFLFFIGAWGIEQANERYDPYEVDEHFYTGFMLEKQGWTPLHMAAAQGDEERVRQLLSDPTQQLEARNHWGRTPLYEAAKRGQLGTMTLLIDRGANLEAKGNHGFTPMFPAIQRGHLKAVELLVSRGAQVDARCECGATALYEAVKWGQEDVAQFLAEHGASVNARINGQTALAYAEEHEMEDMAKILRHFGGKTFKESEELVKKGVEFFKKNQWDQALALFTQAIEKDPESISAYSNRAATQIKKGELDLALGDYRRILQLAPNHIDTYMKISWIHGQRKQWDLGIELWSTLIKIEPKNGLAYYERGRHEFYKPDHEAARQDLRSSCSFGYTEGCDMLKSMGG
jgi:ankyrin repeat protein